MSNSIWKTGDPTYRNDNFDEIIVREYKRWAADGVFYLVDYCTELPNRWAYLLDIIAQADKAERLEKENEAMREEFEVWHGNYKCEVEEKKQLQKAVDLAVLRLEQGKKKFGKSTMGPNKETAMLCEIVIDEIKQLIKGE